MAHKAWTKNRIGRKIIITYVRGFFYNEQNNKTGFFKRLWGDYDLERATKQLTQIMGTNRLLIEAVEYDCMYCSMPLEKFVDNCDVKIQNEKFIFTNEGE